MVKRLMTHYTMYAKSNTTDIDKEVTKNWEEFLHNNTDFIHPFDFVKVCFYPCVFLSFCLKNNTCIAFTASCQFYLKLKD